jgi:hypothetical protein
MRNAKIRAVDREEREEGEWGGNQEWIAAGGGTVERKKGSNA